MTRPTFAATGGSLRAALLDGAPGVRHGFFTREGGVSQGLYQSLNCGFGSRDNQTHVRDNRAIVAGCLGVAPERLLTVHQRHTPNAAIAAGPWRNGPPEADAIVTAEPGLAVAVLTADCAPVLFADAEARVVGAAHAGWRGARSGVIEAALNAMETLGAKRARIAAAVGPAISQASYEVGDELRQAFIDGDPASARFFAQTEGQPRPYFDLAGYVMNRLETAGIGRRYNLGICTRASESLFFSYRRSQLRKEPDYGRQISAIVIL